MNPSNVTSAPALDVDEAHHRQAHDRAAVDARRGCARALYGHGPVNERLALVVRAGRDVDHTAGRDRGEAIGQVREVVEAPARGGGGEVVIHPHIGGRRVGERGAAGGPAAVIISDARSALFAHALPIAVCAVDVLDLIPDLGAAGREDRQPGRHDPAGARHVRTFVRGWRRGPVSLHARGGIGGVPHIDRGEIVGIARCSDVDVLIGARNGGAAVGSIRIADVPRCGGGVSRTVPLDVVVV